MSISRWETTAVLAKHKQKAPSHVARDSNVTSTWLGGRGRGEGRGRSGGSAQVVSQTLTARFDGRVHFYDVSLTGSFKTVCICQNLLYPKGKVCMRAKWPIRPELIAVSVA